MYPELTIFEYKFNNDELKEEFNAFFYRFNLIPLFNNEQLAGHINVSEIDARSIINPGGAHRRMFLELADYLSIASDNDSYEEAVFRLIKDTGHSRTLITKVRKYVEFIRTVQVDHLFNLWNIVWYKKDIH